MPRVALQVPNGAELGTCVYTLIFSEEMFPYILPPDPSRSARICEMTF